MAQAAAFGSSALFAGFYDFSIWGAIGLCFFALLIAVLIAQPIAFGRAGSAAVGGLALILAWSALSMLWAPSVDSAWTETNRAAFYLVTLLLATTALRTKRGAWTVMGVLIVASCVVIAYLTVRLAIGSGAALFVEARLHEPVGYVNGQAGFLLMAFWPLVAVAERARPLSLRAAALAFATLDAGLLVLTQSRAIVPALLISAAVLVALVPGRLNRCCALATVTLGVAAAGPWLLDVYAQRGPSPAHLPAEELVRTAGVALLVAAVAVGVCWVIGVRVAARATSPALRKVASATLVTLLVGGFVAAGLASGNPLSKIEREYNDFVELRVDPNGSERFTRAGGHRYDLWRVAALQFRDRPVGGVGAGNYTSTYYKERRNLDPVRQPHSLWMQVVGELGVVGLVAVVLFAGGVLAGAFGPGSTTLGGTDAGLRVAAGGAFLVWLVQTSFDWLYNLPGITGVALLSAAVLIASPAAGRPERPSRRAMARLVVVVGVAVMAMLSASVGRQYAADWYLERGTAKVAADPDGALRDSRRALRLNSANMRAYYLEAGALARRNDYRGTRDTLFEATRRERFNHVPWTLLGDVAQRRGERAQAARDYGRASRLNPFDQNLRDLARSLGDPLGPGG